jgi:predicted DNA-binding transcriptional regulator AlpA
MEKELNGRVNETERIGVTAKDIGVILSVSARTVWRLNSAGKLPRPVKLGGCVRWNRREIEAWFNAGCPDRRTWDTVKEVGK